MKLRLTWLLILMLALTAFWGCSDDDDPVVPTLTAFEKISASLIEYVNDKVWTAYNWYKGDAHSLIQLNQDH